MDWNLCFEDCTKLKSVKLPEGLELVCMGAFYNCSSLSDVELPEGLTYIGYCTFVGCDKLKSVIIPKSVEGFGLYMPFDRDNIIVYVYEDSYAESFCEEWGYKYVLLSAIPSTKIKLSKSAITMYKGDTRTLKATCKVTVKEIKATKVKLNKTAVTLKKGKSGEGV